MGGIINATGPAQAVFGAIDYSVFGVMLTISLAIGVYIAFFGSGANSTDEYLLGGRNMKTLPIAISLIASQLSGLSMMAYPAEMYSYGTQYTVMLPGMIIVTIIVAFVFIPVFYNAEISNIYEYLERRFDRRVRMLTSFLFVFGVYTFAPIKMFVPAIAFSEVSGMNVHLINSIVGVVCVLYTMLGGIKAVVWTDVVQASVMITSCVAVVTFGIIKVGGVTRVFEIAETGGRLQFFNFDPSLTTRHSFWNQLITSILVWSCYVGLYQSCVQRFVAVPSLNHARRAMYIFCVGFIVMMSITCFTGLVMYAYYSECDPVKAGVVAKADKLMPRFVMDIIGHYPGMPGIFIAAVFSASLSTMSAQLNALSGILYEDYLSKLTCFKHTEFNVNLIMKVTVVITGIYSIIAGLIVENFSHILQMTITITGATYGATLGVFTLGMLTPWANGKGAFYGAVTSLIVMVWIVIGAQMAIQNKTLSYPVLPTSIEGCESLNVTVTKVINSTIQQSTPQEPFFLYKLSFNYYTATGTLIVWIIGIPISFLTGPANPRKLGKLMYSPCIHWLLPKDTPLASLPTTDIEIKDLEFADWKKKEEKEEKEAVLKGLIENDVG